MWSTIACYVVLIAIDLVVILDPDETSGMRLFAAGAACLWTGLAWYAIRSRTRRLRVG